MNFKNKVVVVTGGGSGIGRALSARFAARGAKLVVADLDLASAEATADEFNGLAIRCDVSKEAEIIAVIEQTRAQLGEIDVFCSNAGFGVGEGSHAASASNDTWQKNWDVHVMAHVYAARALLPSMIERGDGYLINVASAAGLLSQISDAAYTASKHAAVAFAESLAITHGDQGIKVSVICPQYVDTNILKSMGDESAKYLPGVISVDQCADHVIGDLEAEKFLILPHAEVSIFMRHRAVDPERWLQGMRRYRASMVNSKGNVEFKRLKSDKL